MLNAISCKEFIFLQEGYSKVSLLLASEKYTEAESLMRGLLEKVTLLKPVTDERADLLYYKKIQAECFTNLASCLFNKGEYEQHFEEVRTLLNKAIQSDHLNYWAYFNLASIYYKENTYRETLQNLNCSLSCLYLIKAVLSKDLENRNRQIDLARSISYSQNNIKARYVRLLMQIKQNRVRFALNEVDLILEIEEKSELYDLKKNLLRIANNSSGIQAADHRELIKLAITLISSVQNQQSRLMSIVKEDLQINALIKEIDDKVYEFNELFRQINELGSSQNIFNFKVMHMTNRFDKRTHIVSNKILKSIKQQKKVSQSQTLRAHSIQLEAKVIERLNQSKKSLNQSKNAYGQSLFQISKSQNMQNSNKMIIGNLLSSINNTTRPFRILSNDDMEQTQLQVDIEGNMRKKLGIDVVQSEIRPINETDEILLSGSEVKPSDNHFTNADDDLLLNSQFDREFQKEKTSVKQIKVQVLAPNNLLKSSVRNEELSIQLYPLSQPYKVLELLLIKADFRDEVKDKLLGIYSQLEYNSGYIETYKFRSRQVNQSGPQNSVDWGQSLGFIKIAQEPKNILIKTYKSEPYYYNDKLLGEGQIEVTTAGIIKVPLYLKMRNVGTVSIKLVISEQNLSSSFKKSVTSNFSSSLKSESQTSQPG